MSNIFGTDDRPDAGIGATETTWSVTRDVPPPNQASAELCQSVAYTPQPPTVKPLPQTDQEWIDASTEASEMFAVVARACAEKWGIPIRDGEIAGVKVFYIDPPEVEARNESRLFLHTHGGGFSMGFGEAATMEALCIAHYAGLRVVSVDYKTIPLHPYPTALNEVISVYVDLLKDLDASAIAFGGSSAGGNLAMAAIHKCKLDGLDTPGAYFAGTPWTDLQKLGDSYFTNEGIDRILPVYEGELEVQAQMYANGEDMSNPLLSPVYGDFSTFPPSQLVSGTRDLLLSPTLRAHRNLRKAGRVADLNIYEGVSHGECLIFPEYPECEQVYTELGAFLDVHLS